MKHYIAIGCSVFFAETKHKLVVVCLTSERAAKCAEMHNDILDLSDEAFAEKYPPSKQMSKLRS